MDIITYKYNLICQINLTICKANVERSIQEETTY